MQQQLGDCQAAALCEALSSTDPTVSVRLNPFKWPKVKASPNGEERENPSCIASENGEERENPSCIASENGWERENPSCIPSSNGEVRENPSGLSLPGALSVPWCPDAFYLPARPPFTFDPLLHAGAYYVQDASSMFLAEVLSVATAYLPERPVVLDLCAAPGGKSTLLRSLLPTDALLLCNEPIPKRAQVLAENMTKWGHPAVVVSQNYPADFAPLEALFDMIVADVPCSGEGMFRKDEGAVSDWSLAAVDLCSRRQRDILSAVWSALKPGGCLVYSTCTFNRLEDEENVQWIQCHLGADVLPVPIRPEWGIHEGEPGLHFFPHKTRGEGFYVALLRKHDGAGEPAARNFSRPFSTLRPPKNPRHAKPSGSAAAPKSFIAEARQWLDGEFVFSADAATCTAFPAPFAELLPLLRQSLRVLSAGIQLGELRGRDWQPAHALALSTALRSGAFTEVELSYSQSLAYLRREAIQLDAPRGLLLLTYCGLPLGFVKNLGTRANNLYPQEWRIRSGYTSPFCLLQ